MQEGDSPNSWNVREASLDVEESVLANQPKYDGLPARAALHRTVVPGVEREMPVVAHEENSPVWDVSGDSRWRWRRRRNVSGSSGMKGTTGFLQVAMQFNRLTVSRVIDLKLCLCARAFGGDGVAVYGYVAVFDDDGIPCLAQDSTNDNPFGGVRLRANHQIAIVRRGESPEDNEISAPQRRLNGRLKPRVVQGNAPPADGDGSHRPEDEGSENRAPQHEPPKRSHIR